MNLLRKAPATSSMTVNLFGYPPYPVKACLIVGGSRYFYDFANRHSTIEFGTEPPSSAKIEFRVADNSRKIAEVKYKRGGFTIDISGSRDNPSFEVW